jgi:hypothetical protein
MDPIMRLPRQSRPRLPLQVRYSRLDATVLPMELIPLSSVHSYTEVERVIARDAQFRFENDHRTYIICLQEHPQQGTQPIVGSTSASATLPDTALATIRPDRSAK